MSKHTDYQWYHPIRLPSGEMTKPQNDYSPSWKLIERCMNFDLCKDRDVLDIGCRDGLYSLKAEQAGAKSVMAIDTCMSKGLVEFILPTFKSKITTEEVSLYQLPSVHRTVMEHYDVILFFGVLYHLRYPMFGLKKCLEILRPNGVIFMETAMMVGEKFDGIPLLFCPTNGHSGYDQSSCTFFNEAGIVETVRSLGGKATLLGTSAVTTGNPPVLRAFFSITKTQSDVSENTWNYWNGTHHSYPRP